MVVFARILLVLGVALHRNLWSYGLAVCCEQKLAVRICIAGPPSRPGQTLENGCRHFDSKTAPDVSPGFQRTCFAVGPIEGERCRF